MVAQGLGDARFRNRSWTLKLSESSKQLSRDKRLVRGWARSSNFSIFQTYVDSMPNLSRNFRPTSLRGLAAHRDCSKPDLATPGTREAAGGLSPLKKDQQGRHHEPNGMVPSVFELDRVLRMFSPWTSNVVPLEIARNESIA